jgi:hypothetical protein
MNDKRKHKSSSKSLISNSRCMADLGNNPRTHTLLHSCTKSFPGIQLTDIIGEGSFGIMYKGISTYTGYQDNTIKDIKTKFKNKKSSPVVPKTMTVAVKITKNKLTHDDFEDLVHEIEYSYYMGSIGLAPKIYETFYYINDEDEYKQVLIMEYYPYDCNTFLKNSSDHDARIVVKNMIKILKQMIFKNKMYCVDIKPGNFVVNDDLDVKIIDFGRDWCTPDKLPVNNEDELYQVLLFQLMYMIKTYTNRTFDDIFCKEFSDDLSNIIERYYNSSNLTLKHYVKPYNGVSDIIKCKDSPRRSPRRSSPKRSSSKRSSPKRSSPKRSSPKRSSPKRSSPKRSSPKRSSPKRSSPKRSSPKRSIKKSLPKYIKTLAFIREKIRLHNKIHKNGNMAMVAL